MDRELMWRFFSETGAPVFYLLYRHSAGMDKSFAMDMKGTGDEPVPAD